MVNRFMCVNVRISFIPLIKKEMSLTRAREFLLGLYHDLPNVLLVGSLILGSITGYLPLVWVALGLMLNGGLIAVVQGLLSLLFPTWAQVFISTDSPSCHILSGQPGGSDGVTAVAPSHWLGAAVFFAVFSVYNSIRVGIKPATAGAKSEKVDSYKRCFELFDGRDEEAVADTRERWKAYKAAGHTVVYWQQTESGGWEKKA